MARLTHDEKWKRFNEKLTQLMKINDFYGLGTTYYEMSDFLQSEGKDGEYLREKGYEMKLQFQRDQLQSRYRGVVEVFCAEDSCEHCLKFNNKRFSVDDALKVNPIPVMACTHKYGCRCTYAPVVVG